MTPRPPRATGRTRRVAVGVAVVLAIGVSVGVVSGLAGDVEPSRVAFAGDLRRGGKLEELRLPALDGGGAIEYARYADRPLVINFFASWCPSCIAEMPAFERVHSALGDRVGFLGVSQSDAREASVELVGQTGVTYDTAIDARGEFFRAIGGVGMPTTIFVRPGGEIAEIWVGALDEASLRQLVEEHLDTAA